jgi:hypothetical protein
MDIQTLKDRVEILSKDIMQKNADINFLMGSKCELDALIKTLQSDMEKGQDNNV